MDPNRGQLESIELPLLSHYITLSVTGQPASSSPLITQYKCISLILPSSLCLFLSVPRQLHLGQLGFFFSLFFKSLCRFLVFCPWKKASCCGLEVINHSHCGTASPLGHILIVVYLLYINACFGMGKTCISRFEFLWDPWPLNAAAVHQSSVTGFPIIFLVTISGVFKEVMQIF